MSLRLIRSRRLRPAVVLGALAGLAATAVARPPSFAPWIDGTAAREPDMQVQAIDPDTFVLRQSVRTNFEAPFLYLLFGTDRALLLDSGAGGLAVRPTVDRLVVRWRQRHGGRPVHLVVAHSHGHGDHHAGDAEFEDRPDTEVVGLRPEQVAAFFQVADWPRGTGRYDLGGRVLAVVPTPGHEPAHIMVYDPRTQLLLSGDMLYPGRLYVPVSRFAEFRDSAARLAAFAATHPIRALLGAHIEMTTTPGQDFPMQAATHPHEHPLPLPPSAIAELLAATEHAGPAPTIDRHRDFILYPRPASLGPSSAISASQPAWSSPSNRPGDGLSRSSTPSSRPSATIGTTSSDADAASQAIWPGKACTSVTSCVVRVAAAVPHTPRPNGMRMHAALPWNGPSTSSSPTAR